MMIDGLTERAMRGAFSTHRSRAKGRGIAFDFTYETWRAWWSIDSRWARRGRRKDDLVMARRGDLGPYSLDNVYCTTQAENCAECNSRITPGMRHAAAARREASGLPRKPRRVKSPKSRAVRTQIGVFATATLAAKAFEITRQHAARMAREKIEGWEYV